MGVERTWILILLPIAVALLVFWKGKSFLVFPSLEPVPENRVSRIFSFAFRTSWILLLLLLIILSAGLRFTGGERIKYGYGADIVFLLDESRSMKDPFGSQESILLGARSPEGPSKFSAAKKAIAQFMEKRRSGQDRYGLTGFGQSAVQILPLTMNHELFLRSLESQECVLSSTFIYNPIASGLNELMQSGARSRVLVLVSDGGGPVDDKKFGFSAIVRKYGIRFYWVSLGTEWLNELPEFVEKLGTLGRRMDISNGPELEKGFEEIHRLEKSIVRYKSSTPGFSAGPIVYSALLLMALTWISHSMFVYRRNGST